MEIACRDPAKVSIPRERVSRVETILSVAIPDCKESLYAYNITTSACVFQYDVTQCGILQREGGQVGIEYHKR